MNSVGAAGLGHPFVLSALNRRPAPRVPNGIARPRPVERRGGPPRSPRISQFALELLEARNGPAPDLRSVLPSESIRREIDIEGLVRTDIGSRAVAIAPVALFDRRIELLGHFLSAEAARDRSGGDADGRANRAAERRADAQSGGSAGHCADACADRVRTGRTADRIDVLTLLAGRLDPFMFRADI